MSGSTEKTTYIKSMSSQIFEIRQLDRYEDEKDSKFGVWLLFVGVKEAGRHCSLQSHREVAKAEDERELVADMSAKALHSHRTGQASERAISLMGVSECPCIVPPPETKP